PATPPPLPPTPSARCSRTRRQPHPLLPSRLRRPRRRLRSHRPWRSSRGPVPRSRPPGAVRPLRRPARLWPMPSAASWLPRKDGATPWPPRAGPWPISPTRPSTASSTRSSRGSGPACAGRWWTWPSGSSATRSPASKTSASFQTARARAGLPAIRSPDVRSVVFATACRGGARTSRARRARAEVGRLMGGRRRLSLRSLANARRRLRHRHAAAHRQRLAARRTRLLVHPHRYHRALHADAREGSVLPHGVGRQRPADRAPCAELLRRALRSVAAVRPVVRAAREAGQAAGRSLAPELHRTLRATDRRGREGLRRAVEAPRALGRLAADLRDDWQGRTARLAGLVPPLARTRRGLSARSADAVGRRFPHGR